MAERSQVSTASLSPAERALRLFTDIRPGEAPASLAMLASVFLILAAYYFVKPAREGLLAASVVSGISDTELKAYSSFGQSLLLLGVIPIYDSIANRLRRRALVTATSAFFASNLVCFWALQPGLIFESAGWVGIAFYLWVGIFNVFIVAQFWSFAADVYSDEAGRRLIPMIAIGATAGAATGSWIAKTLVPIVGTFGLVLVAAAVLFCSIVTLRIADSRAAAAEYLRTDRERTRPSPGGTGSAGFRLVWRHRYLLATAFLILVLNWVNTNGENFLFGAVEREFEAKVAARGLTGEGATEFLRDETTRFYGDLSFWVNGVALFLQAFVASRVLRYGGFGAILLSLPLISLLSYSAMAIFPLLAVMRVAKIAENSTNYSLTNTARQVLWLPTTTEMKYKAKAVVDTLFVRFGDALAAVTAFAGTRLLDVSPRWLFGFNAGLVLIWFAVCLVVVREHGRLTGAEAAQVAA
ncbi:MAG: NTP/NDP exchange transporter [Candidatus Binatia bacterium]